eukprot:TRINITY_DN69110_c0_g1_i1.p1 TRINITY_DN69110_c0_g1~~TRINITY_DN69110_c0_g1_i1.p1  ORF type:complete len:229 (-),score=34.70 TRINITY_DN69110_c0_g1_i1:86-673(-)
MAPPDVSKEHIQAAADSASDDTVGSGQAMALLARLTMESQGPVPTFSDFGQVPSGNPWGAPSNEASFVPSSNPWNTGGGSPAAPVTLTAQEDPVLGPSSLIIHFPWGSETFRRCDEVQCKRFIYRCPEAIQGGSGGLILCFQEGDGGYWEVSGSLSGWLFRRHSKAETPTDLADDGHWIERSGSSIVLRISNFVD